MPGKKGAVRAKPVPLEDILLDREVQIRAGGLREAAVQRYMEAFEQLPPVDIFQTPEHPRLLADGFHRVEAARRLGKGTIIAYVQPGSRREALEHASVANMRSGEPLTTAERQAAILRMVALHPTWSQARIGKALGIEGSAVSFATRSAAAVQRHPGLAAFQTLVRDILPLPESLWEEVLDAAARRQWGSYELRLMTKNLRDPALPDSFKRELLAGRADPIVQDATGAAAIPTRRVMARVAAQIQSDPGLMLERVLALVAQMRNAATWEETVRSIEPHRRQTLREDLPRAIAYLNDGLRALVKSAVEVVG
jgi:hypothetical protein